MNKSNDLEDQPPPPPHPLSILSTQQGACALVSILLMKLGGKVVINASDFAMIFGTRFCESNEQPFTDQPTGQAIAVWVDQPAEIRPPGSSVQ